jgi:hypothetical protein
VAVALEVFGTLTVQEVISSGGTALAVVAEPVLGRAGYWLMSVTALFSIAIALLVFTLVTAAHFRVRGETGASTLVLSVAITSTVVVLLTFALTTLVEEPATAVALASWSHRAAAVGEQGPLTRSR